MIGPYRKSRAASTLEVRVCEMDSNDVLISKPLQKVEEITETKTTKERQAQV